MNKPADPVRTSDHRLTGWALLIERLYRWTHHGQIRTLVLSRDQQYAREQDAREQDG
jgi:hypothetical protein